MLNRCTTHAPEAREIQYSSFCVFSFLLKARALINTALYIDDQRLGQILSFLKEFDLFPRTTSVDCCQGLRKGVHCTGHCVHWYWDLKKCFNPSQ